MFTEGILIAQYVYQIPTRLHCSFITLAVQNEAEIAGIHGNALRSVPIFFVYLATLMHTYQLSRHQVTPANRDAHDDSEPEAACLEERRRMWHAQDPADAPPRSLEGPAGGSPRRDGAAASLIGDATGQVGPGAVIVAVSALCVLGAERLPPGKLDERLLLCRRFRAVSSTRGRLLAAF